MILNNATEQLGLVSTSTSALHVDIAYVLHDNTTGQAVPSAVSLSIVTATTTILLAGVGSGKTQITNISIVNAGALSNTITMQKDSGGTNYEKTAHITLSGNEKLDYIDKKGYQVYNASGLLKIASSSKEGFSGYSRTFLKVGTAKEAAGIHYGFGKDGGFPGAWSPGGPGLSGRICDNTLIADAGCIAYPDATIGKTHIVGFICASSIAENVFIDDYLWVNNGIAVATTTAQTVNSVAWPARDNFETANGDGIQVALLVTTVTTNGAAVTTITMSYTNSVGVAGRTATMPSFPATAVVGTFVPFLLQSGDKGVRSIQSITLGTTLATGNVALVAFNQILQAFIPLAAFSGKADLGTRGRGLPNRCCLIPRVMTNGTGLSTINGEIMFEEK
jgi:hypothetical protein